MSKNKHEILFSRFEINYNTLPERFRKGTVLVREEVCVHRFLVPQQCHSSFLRCIWQIKPTLSTENTAGLNEADPSQLRVGEDNAKPKKPKIRTQIELRHCDVIESAFWDTRPYLLD